MCPLRTPRAVALQPCSGPVNAYHNEEVSVQHHLGVGKHSLVCVEGCDANPVPSENRPLQPVALVTPAHGLLLPTQQQQERELDEEQVEKKHEGGENSEFVKQRRMLEKMGQELRVMQEQINQHQEELTQEQEHSKQMRKWLETKENELELSSKDLQQEWERLRHTREEYLRFEKRQLEQFNRERLEMRRREVFWQQRVQEQEATFFKMRKEMQKRDLHIDLRNRHLARRETRIAERELAVTQLELTLQERTQAEVETSNTNYVGSEAKIPPVCKESHSDSTASCSANVHEGKTSVST